MNDDYLKMVLALPDEFFEGWEWKAGDKAITITSHREVMIISNELISKSKYPGFIKVIYPYSDDDTPEFLKIHHVRPIPSQEQLQQIMDMGPIGFIEDFYEYAQDPLHEGMDASIFHIDLNCFTLAYVMDRKYKKYWDGESWI